MRFWKGDRRWRRAAVLAGALALAVLTAVLLADGGGPETPAALYRERCAACHALADLSGFAPGQRAAIVRTMRARHGADEVISDEEADVITRHLIDEAAR